MYLQRAVLAEHRHTTRAFSSHTAWSLALVLAALVLTEFVQAPASAIVDRDCSEFNTQSAAQTFYVNAAQATHTASTSCADWNATRDE